MSQMLSLVEVLVIFLVIILIGWVLRRSDVVTYHAKHDLNTLMMMITLPAMLIGGFFQPFDEALTEKGLLIAALTVAMLAVSFLVGLIFMKIFKIKVSRQGVWLLVSTFSNLGFMGFPVIETMYGQEGLFLASFVQIPYGPCFFFFGALMMTKTQTAQGISLRKILLTPVMIAVEIGLVLYFLQIKPPAFVINLLSIVGSMTGPIAMLIIGMALSEFPLINIFNSLSLYQLSFVRLLAVPVTVALALRLLPSTGNALLVPVLVIICAMSGPSNATNMAVTYGGDTDFAAKITALTAILSLVTLPIVFLIL